ncbi:MAG: methyltransferase domain-containing protein [Flavobacterium sp.]|nr:MAG: methyltransferase domain-containing protein [Flavobacterium sp.]
MSDSEEYLNQFGDISQLNRDILLAEMDQAWTTLNLDNTKKVVDQSELISKFYQHPVWILNGIFSELDPISREHREAIAEFISTVGNDRIADFGGGTGVLAKFIARRNPASNIEIVDPYFNMENAKKLSAYPNVHIKQKLDGLYDVVIAQDVLEHVDDPIELALHLIDATKLNGYVVFANSFYPEIKCHLPSSFYLRHTFRFLIRHAGLQFTEGLYEASHVHVYKKTHLKKHKKIFELNYLAKIIGPKINIIVEKLRALKRRIVSI